MGCMEGVAAGQTILTRLSGDVELELVSLPGSIGRLSYMRLGSRLISNSLPKWEICQAFKACKYPVGASRGVRGCGRAVGHLGQVKGACRFSSPCALVSKAATGR